MILHPGSSAGTPHKRWPVQSFADLAMRLAETGERVLVAHGPGERELAAAVVERCAHVLKAELDRELVLTKKALRKGAPVF